MILLGAYFFLIMWGLKVASQAGPLRGRVGRGRERHVLLHTVINVGMVLGLSARGRRDLTAFPPMAARACSRS